MVDLPDSFETSLCNSDFIVVMGYYGDDANTAKQLLHSWVKKGDTFVVGHLTSIHHNHLTYRPQRALDFDMKDAPFMSSYKLSADGGLWIRLVTQGGILSSHHPFHPIHPSDPL